MPWKECHIMDERMRLSPGSSTARRWRRTCPAINTIHAVLARQGLVQHCRRRRHPTRGTELSRPTAPNALRCADYKGEFMLGIGATAIPSRSRTSPAYLLAWAAGAPYRPVDRYASYRARESVRSLEIVHDLG